MSKFIKDKRKPPIRTSSVSKFVQKWVEVDGLYEFWIEGWLRPNGIFSVVTEIGERRALKSLTTERVDQV